MNVLVTGGAGYVGSIVAEELLKAGHKVVVVDSLKEGHRQAVPQGPAFVKGDIADQNLLVDTFNRYQVYSVMHMAAETVVEQSMINPRAYFSCNLTKSITLLDTMLEHGIHKLVFSPTAAVYGEPVNTPIMEDDPHIPHQLLRGIKAPI